jgi:hypothetical protein
MLCIDKWLWVTGYTQPWNAYKVIGLLLYLLREMIHLPGGDGVCARLTWGINILEDLYHVDHNGRIARYKQE